MKLNRIAALFKRNKHLTIYNAPNGEQWISNGRALYTMRGLPKMTPEIVLKIFDVPQDKTAGWICKEAELPQIVSFDDYADDETDIEPEKINLSWFGETYYSFPSGYGIHAINAEYIKPLLDEPDYLTFHGRTTDNGVFILACKVAMELRAIILPATIYRDKHFIESLSRANSLYRAAAEREQSNEAVDPFGDDLGEAGAGEWDESGAGAEQESLFGIDPGHGRSIRREDSE